MCSLPPLVFVALVFGGISGANALPHLPSLIFFTSLLNAPQRPQLMVGQTLPAPEEIACQPVNSAHHTHEKWAENTLMQLLKSFALPTLLRSGIIIRVEVKRGKRRGWNHNDWLHSVESLAQMSNCRALPLSSASTADLAHSVPPRRNKGATYLL